MNKSLAEWLTIPVEDRETILELLRAFKDDATPGERHAVDAAIALLDSGPTQAAEPGSGPPPPHP